MPCTATVSIANTVASLKASSFSTHPRTPFYQSFFDGDTSERKTTVDTAKLVAFVTWSYMVCSTRSQAS